MSFILVSVLLCLFFGPTVGAKDESEISVVVLKYSALDRTETANLHSQRYSFEFCACSAAMSAPSPSSCSCSKQQGKSVIDSTPFALFSKSCLVNPKSSKCLIATIPTESGIDKVSAAILVKVSLGNRVLSSPEWQRIKNSHRKTVDYVKSNTLYPIKLTYHVFVDSSSVEESEEEDEIESREETRRPEQRRTSLSITTHSSPAAIQRTTTASTTKAATHLSTHRTASTSISHHTTSTTRGSTTRRTSHWIATTTHAPLIEKMTKATTPLFSRRDAPPPSDDYRKDTIDYHKHSSSAAVDKDLFKMASSGELQSLTDINKIRNYLMANGAIARRNPLLVPVNKEFLREKILQFHNIYRAFHGAPPVSYDRTLETAATAWCDNLATRSACLQHDPVHRYGESLFYYGSTLFPNELFFAAATVQSFYMEAPLYTTYRPNNYHITGHFTQLVWQASRKIGIGISVKDFRGPQRNPCQPHRPMFQIYICVKYDPPGNVQSAEAYIQNVRRRL